MSETTKEERDSKNLEYSVDNDMAAMIGDVVIFRVNSNFKNAQREYLTKSIIHRCNCHDDLVAVIRALKERIHFIDWPAEPMRDGKPDWLKEVALIEAALAKAKEN